MTNSLSRGSGVIFVSSESGPLKVYEAGIEIVSSRGLLLEQLRERRASIIRRAGRSLALHDSARHEQLTLVACVLVHDLHGDRFTTFEVRAWIEVVALATRVQLGATVGAGGFEDDVRRCLHAARGALHALAKRHHPGRPRAFIIARLLRRL